MEFGLLVPGDCPQYPVMVGGDVVVALVVADAAVHAVALVGLLLADVLSVVEVIPAGLVQLKPEGLLCLVLHHQLSV